MNGLKGIQAREGLDDIDVELIDSLVERKLMAG